MNNCAIIIPAYKEKLENSEILSLNQCFKVLKNYSTFIITSSSLNLSSYQVSSKINIIRFNDVYFKNINGYNKLMLSKQFYSKFKHFKYLLIYQLDAFVFRDDLQYWCDLNYDYIGAPWKNLFVDNQRGEIDYGVGNGGFSLRKVSSFIKVLKSWHFVYEFSFLYKSTFYNNSSNNIIISLLKLLYCFLLRNNFYYLLNGYDRNEDLFWGNVVNEKHSWFKIPNVQEAANFSIDEHPNYFISFVKTKTPMGCHAWPKNHDVFWKDYIK